MRYDLTDFEWAAVEAVPAEQARSVPRVNDRRVLNGIFWVLRSGAPWRDLPVSFGPRTTCYNRFVRSRGWREGRIMNALSADHDAAAQMIDTSIVRVHQHGAPGRYRTEAMCFSPYLYRARNLVERFLNKIKRCRRVATCYDKLAANHLRICPDCVNTTVARANGPRTRSHDLIRKPVHTFRDHA